MEKAEDTTVVSTTGTFGNKEMTFKFKKVGNKEMTFKFKKVGNKEITFKYKKLGYKEMTFKFKKVRCWHSSFTVILEIVEICNFL